MKISWKRCDHGNLTDLRLLDVREDVPDGLEGVLELGHL